MTHFYKDKSFADDKRYRLICEKGWVTDTRDHAVPRRLPAFASTVPHNVTCPKCLDILIPKAQANLKVMLENRAKAIGEQGVPEIATHSVPEVQSETT